MPEGLSPAEVGKEIAEHKKHTAADHDEDDGHHDRWLSILEALLLSLVAVLAAYSGYAAAKWGTESSVALAKASAQRTKANRADIEGIVTRTLDSVSFNAWFTAFIAGNANAERLAAKRMRPGYRRRSKPGWRQTRHTIPTLLLGRRTCRSTSFPRRPPRRHSTRRPTPSFSDGADAGATADKYIRDTVFLATVLFLVGISGHFRIRSARLGLIGVGALLLVFAVIQLLGLPAPP